MAGIPAGYESSSSDSGDDIHGYSRSRSYNVSQPKSNSYQNSTRISTSRKTTAKGRPLEDLRMAVMKGNLNDVRTFLDETSLSIDSPLTTGWSALMYAASCGWNEIVDLLLERGANPNFHRDFYTPLMACCAARRDCYEQLNKCAESLIKGGADVNARDRRLMTPLMFAAREGKDEIVKALLAAGADINTADGTGWTALCWSAHYGKGRVVRYLLEHGALMKQLPSGETAVDIARNANHVELAKMMESNNFSTMNGDVEPGEIKTNNLASPITESSRQVVPRTYIKSQDDLSLFLNGLKLSHLLPMFQKEGVTMLDLLQMDEKDLENIGVDQYAVRKRILDSIKTVHTAPWQKSSVHSHGKGKLLGCPDVITVLGNVTEHQRHIWTTIRFLRDALQKNLIALQKCKPCNGELDNNILEVGQDIADVSKLSKEVDLTMSEVETLVKELKELKKFATTAEKYPELNSVEFGNPLALRKKHQKSLAGRVLFWGAVGIAAYAAVKANRAYVLPCY